MYQLAKKLASLQPYDPPRGDFAVRADANESFLGLGPELSERLLKKLHDTPLGRYPDPLSRDLCAAYAAYTGATPEQVAAGNGSDELIGVVIGAFLQKGEAILMSDPDFSMYNFYAHLYENPVFGVPKRPGMITDVDDLLREAAEVSARMILFSNPCNPTGGGMRREEVLRLCHGTDALVVVDEAYMDFWDQSIVSEVAELDNVIVLRTCSKLVGLAGVRVGFAVANERLIRALLAGKSPYNLSVLAQTVGEVVLSDAAHLANCRSEILKAAQDIGTLLQDLAERKRGIKAIYPSVTNFFYLEVEDAEGLAARLLERGVAVRRLRGAIRISACPPEENRMLAQALDELLQ